MDEKEREELLKEIEEYTEKIKEEPNNSIYYNNRGRAYRELENYEEAIKDYNEAIELDPNNSIYYNNRGRAYRELENYEEAIKDYKKAIELEPDEAYYYYSRGRTYRELENYEETIKDYKKVIELEPNNETYYNSIATTYYNFKEFEKAIENYKKAIELDSNNSSYYNNIAAAYYNLKEYDKAIESCNSAIELTNNDLFYSNRGRIYSKLKKYQEAIGEYEKTIELNPDNEMTKKLKDITSNYLKGNFKKTKASLISFREKYKTMSEKHPLDLSFEELTEIKDFLENIQEELEGYLTFADILGWKGIWRKQNTKEEKVDTLNTLLFIKNKLEEEFKDKKESYKINLISDTYVIYAKEQELSNKLSKRLIELCLENDLLIRGATSYGKFYNNDMVYIGQAVDDAASWHEKGEEIGIFYTPSARLNEKISNSKLEEIFLINGEVNTKNGKIETFFVNWYSEENKKNFYNIMKNEIITPDISSKYFNTEKKLNKYVKDEIDCIEEEKE